jgi:hypothetical protein
MYLTAALHELVSFPYNHYTITSYISQGVFMISMQELLKDAKLEDQDQVIQDNLTVLLERINKVRTAWDHPMTVTSGLRTKADQLRIYKAKGIAESKIPWGSAHIKGSAVDIFDLEKKLQQWCLDNVDKLEEFELWCEDFSATPNWVHFQTYPPASGKRFFKP